jgi:hypothetical protein
VVPARIAEPEDMWEWRERLPLDFYRWSAAWRGRGAVGRHGLRLSSSCSA